MEFSREFMDKIRESFGDLETIYPNLAGLEILLGMEMDDILRKTVEEESRFFSINKEDLDECIKKLNEKIKAGDTITAADIFESRGFDQDTAPDYKHAATGKPTRKVYEDLSYIASMESTRCRMLIDKLKATIELLDAQQKYYDTMSMIECDNEHFGFDLSI